MRSMVEGAEACTVLAMRAPVLTQKRARSLRRTMTLPEVSLWQRLRGHRPGIRRQHAMGPYILDFYCAAARLCIEIDGQTHDLDHDTRRDAWLKTQGIDTIRLPAGDVLRDPDAVARFVLDLVRDKSSPV